MSAIHERILPNGMTLLFWPQHHLHGVEFGLYLKAGAVYETEETQGISHLLEHLCFRGLGGLGHDELQRVLNRFGTELEGVTYPEAIAFHLTGLPRFFDGMLELFTRFFSGTPWTPEQIDIEKQVVLRQIEEAEDDFDDAVDRAWRETLGGAYPIMGSAEVVAGLSLDTILNWQRLVFQPQNACLVITGNFSAGMERAAVEAFTPLRNYTNEPPFEQSLPLGFCMRDEESDTVLDGEGTHAQVHIAFDIDNDSVFPLAAQMLNAVTAGNSDSLLFQSLREEQALVAEIDSCIEQLGAFQRLVIRYDVRSAFLEESLTKVFTCLHRLSMYIRPIRLNQVRTRFTASNALACDSVSALNEIAGSAWIAGDAARADLDAQTQQFADLTAEELLDAAQTIFRPENLSITVQRDPEALTADLTALFKRLRAML